MKSLHIVPALLLALVLSACAITPDAQVAAACRSYAATLSSLAELRAEGELSEGQVESVNGFRLVANPICAAPSAAGSDALGTMADVLRGMSRIKVEAQQ